ncbi:class I SAM-dependent methyltransferase [Paenibacillus spongiae]|uniref:Phospholipid methyltransferase n=1 Tax=Paenibacillus spongiae TaxID=2909671 RepID=A0ABY5SJP4_9BACL|nr:phospholipid methyltransferase [Paenibacillus spongiae]UVI32890.1 phospholipid methyltransferase [Paenibacillus spongiae]
MTSNIKAQLQERLLFISRFIKAPGQIGSLTPSSKFLAKKMIEAVPWKDASAIAELGAGTGAITKYIPRYARTSTKVLLFEKDAFLRTQLERQYPEFPCYADGCELQLAVRSEGIEQLDCILSGLPFFNFPRAVRSKLIEQIRLSLKPGGLFIAFQYSQQMKSQLCEHFIMKDIQFVTMNVPPAFVYICQNKGGSFE